MGIILFLLCLKEKNYPKLLLLLSEVLLLRPTSFPKPAYIYKEIRIKGFTAFVIIITFSFPCKGLFTI